MRAGQLDKAVALYATALSDAQPGSALAWRAQAGYEDARQRVFSRWWRYGAYFPPLRWYYTNPRPASFWLLIALLSVALLFALAPSVSLGKFGFLSFLGKALKLVFMPRFRGRARILEPTKMTSIAEASMFTSALRWAASYEVENRFKRVHSAPQVPGLPLLSPESALTGQTADALPPIKGVDVGKLFKLLLSFVRYFGWRVETELAFLPALKEGEGHCSGTARMKATATLRWGWFISDSFSVERTVCDQYDVNSVAFALAARIVGGRFANSSKRTNRRKADTKSAAQRQPGSPG